MVAPSSLLRGCCGPAMLPLQRLADSATACYVMCATPCLSVPLSAMRYALMRWLRRIARAATVLPLSLTGHRSLLELTMASGVAEIEKQKERAQLTANRSAWGVQAVRRVGVLCRYSAVVS